MSAVMADEAYTETIECRRPPRVSVVIPLYNKAKHIKATLASVLAQTVQDFEVVVVDDGSTDGSGDIAAATGDPRVRVVRQLNGGESAARNRGIAEARTDLIALIDADDFWYPHFLQTVLALRERFPQAGAYAAAFVGIHNGAVIRFNHPGISNHPEGEIVRNYFQACTLGSNIISSSSVLIPKSVLEHVGGFPVGIINGADLHTWARIAFQYPIAWSTVESAVWNLDAENRTGGRVFMEDAPFAEVVKDAQQQKTAVGEQAKWARAYLSKFRIHYALVAIEQGRRAEARRLLWLARGAARQSSAWWLVAAKAVIPLYVLRLARQLRHALQFGRQA